MSKNLISIIIPTFNRANLIGETLNSIIRQTYIHWECIIVDDGSSDYTEELIKSFNQKDNRIQYYKRPLNRIKGANACRNYGFEVSKGDFVKWFDSDDIMHPDFLKKQLELLTNKSELDFCAGFSETFVDHINNVVAYNNPQIYIDDPNSLNNYIVGKLIFLTPSPLWRRTFLENKKLFDESLANAHETDFNFARLIEGARFEYIKEILFFVRRGHESIDSKSHTHIPSQVSMFKYYQKVFLYLRSENTILEIEDRKILAKFVLLKQLRILYRLRKISPIVDYFDELKTAFRNVFIVELKFINYIKILFGMFLLVFFKRGYSFIDLDEMKF